MKAARDSGLSKRSFGVAWALRIDAADKALNVDPKALARAAGELHARFANASVDPDDQRRRTVAL